MLKFLIKFRSRLTELCGDSFFMKVIKKIEEIVICINFQREKNFMSELITLKGLSECERGENL